MSGPFTHTEPDYVALASRIREIAREYGFQRCGIADVELGEDETHLRDWLAKGLYGSMEWMSRHGDKRSRPDDLVPGT
jgi:epoxyqueuosine reductase